MKERVSTLWAAHHFDACLAQIRSGGAGFVLYENDTPIAELIPLADRHRTTLGELLDALAPFPVDEDFAADLQSVKAAGRVLDNPRDSSSAIGGSPTGGLG